MDNNIENSNSDNKNLDNSNNNDNNSNSNNNNNKLFNLVVLIIAVAALCTSGANLVIMKKVMDNQKKQSNKRIERFDNEVKPGKIDKSDKSDKVGKPDIADDDKDAKDADDADDKDIQYVMYLGTNDKDTNKPVFDEDEAKEKAEEVLLEHFGGYTISDADGGWKDGDKIYTEYSLVIYLSDTDIESVHKAADELIKKFNQSSVLIQENETSTEFYEGK
ncbi:MAG: DUF3574 domain-containing protein [Lachnospiraceae bacterium]|nr:DUF3574 domain-containing protein [Lachnospiraceae bacterium]